MELFGYSMSLNSLYKIDIIVQRIINEGQYECYVLEWVIRKKKIIIFYFYVNFCCYDCIKQISGSPNEVF